MSGSIDALRRRRRDPPREDRPREPDHHEGQRATATRGVRPSVGDRQRRRAPSGRHRRHCAPERQPRRTRALLGVGGGLPLEQVLVRDVHAPQRAHDGVDHQPGLVRKHGERESPAPRVSLRSRAESEGAVETKLTLRGRNTIASASEKYAGKSTTSSMKIGHESAEPGRSSQPNTNMSSVVGETSERRRLSSIFQRCSGESGLTLAPVRRVPTTVVAEPRERLPVAAHPAMQARGRGEVVGRVVVEHLDVARKRGAQERALDEVVREQRVLGEAALEHAGEDVDLEDALARERALAEHVLVRVGDGPRVGVDPGRPRVHRRERLRREPGSVMPTRGCMQPVAARRPARCPGATRAVERVRDRAR